jgi:hypothetical protein
MIYIFCDEAISSDSSYWVYLYSAVAFSQRKYKNSGFSRIKRLTKGGPSLLKPINETLKATEGLALLSHAQVPESLLPQGAVWKTNDISGMSPKDFVWSVSMILTVAYLIRMLLERKWKFKTVDVFYDPKSLSQEHKIAVEKVLQDRLKQHLKRFLQSTNHHGRVKVRRVKAVEKPKPGSTHDKFQLGTWLADRIVRRYNKVVNMERRNLIETKDITQDVVDTLNDFLNRCHPKLKENQSDAH